MEAYDQFFCSDKFDLSIFFLLGKTFQKLLIRSILGLQTVNLCSNLGQFGLFNLQIGLSNFELGFSLLQSLLFGLDDLLDL